MNNNIESRQKTVKIGDMEFVVHETPASESNLLPESSDNRAQIAPLTDERSGQRGHEKNRTGMIKKIATWATIVVAGPTLTYGFTHVAAEHQITKPLPADFTPELHEYPGDMYKSIRQILEGVNDDTK